MGFEIEHKSALLSSVERVLLKTGNTSSLVAKKLDIFYSCTIRDCLERPEYLRTALRYVYRDDYRFIIDKIKLELGELANEVYISDFIKTLESGLELEPLCKCPKCGYIFVPEPVWGMRNYVAGHTECPKCRTPAILYRKDKF